MGIPPNSSSNNNNSQVQGGKYCSNANLFTATNPGNRTTTVSSHIPMSKIVENQVRTHRGEAYITFEDSKLQEINMIKNIMLVSKFSDDRPTLKGYS